MLTIEQLDQARDLVNERNAIVHQLEKLNKLGANVLRVEFKCREEDKHSITAVGRPHLVEGIKAATNEILIEDLKRINRELEQLGIKVG